MALEIAASIIGILTAAGKVAETLGPVVSAFQDVTKHITCVLSEVNNSRIILSALQTYLSDLSARSRLRKELIQVDQTGSCTHGWRLALLRTGSARVAADWYSGKSTKPYAMGNERQEILLVGITDAAFQKLNHSDAEYPAVNGTGFTDPDTYNYIYSQSYGTASNLQFEKVLFSSKVYRKAKALSDVSFRSFIGLSHAWTALSALSLSEISNVSLVALPIYTTDLVVKDSHNASPHELIEKVADRVDLHEDHEHPQGHMHLEPVTCYTAAGAYGGGTFDFSVRVVNDGSVPQGIMRAQMDRHQSQCGSAFMLIYKIHSRTSFDRILLFYRDLIKIQSRNDVCILVAGLHCERRDGDRIAEKVETFARDIGASFIGIDSSCVDEVCMAFSALVHLYLASPRNEEATNGTKDKKPFEVNFEPAKLMRGKRRMGWMSVREEYE